MVQDHKGVLAASWGWDGHGLVMPRLPLLGPLYLLGSDRLAQDLGSSIFHFKFQACDKEDTAATPGGRVLGSCVDRLPFDCYISSHVVPIV